MTRSAFVTGATSGIGLATARRLCRDGWSVVAAGRRADRLDRLAAEFPGRVTPLALDLLDKAALAAIPPAHLSPDLLVNNAGLALGLGPAQEADPAEWDTMVATNITALLRLTRLVLPGMVACGAGTVVNLGSVAGTYPYPGGNVYGATKAFVAQFGLNLRADLLGTGIRVCTVEPGMVDGSEFSDVRFRGDAARARGVYAGARALRPDDVAETIAWVAGLPPHVNVNRIELMPTCQASAALAVSREDRAG